MNSLRIAQLSMAGLLVGLMGCTEPRSPTATPTLSPSSAIVTSPSVAPSVAAVAQKSDATKALEYRLKAEVAKKSGIPVQSIVCPITANPEDGKPFDCQATAANQTFLVALRPKGLLPATTQADTKTTAAIPEGSPGESFANVSRIAPTAQPQLLNPSPKSALQWNTKGLLVLPKLEKTIQKSIKAQFQIEVKPNCGGKLRVVKPGDTFTCQVTDQKGTTKPITVRVDDEKGNVTLKF